MANFNTKHWSDFQGDLEKKYPLTVTLTTVNEGKQWHATSNHSIRMVIAQTDPQEALRLALINAGYAVQSCTKMEAIAEVIEELENDGAGWCAKIRWLYNPIPVGEQLYWPQPTAQEAPIDMVLHCPSCGLQHIDQPNHWSDKFDAPMGGEAPEDRATLDDAVRNYEAEWTNPPHRSHLCHGCGHIWRPADVPTNGVAAVKTKGKVDSPITTRVQATDSILQDAKRWHGWAKAMVEAAALGGVEESPFMLEFERIVGDAEGGFTAEQLNAWTDATIAALLTKQGATNG